MMAGQSGGDATPKLNLGGVLSPSSITVPSDQYHLITDQELTAIVNVKKPVQASLAIFAAGLVLPALGHAWPAIEAIKAGLPITQGMGWLLVLTGATMIVIVCGVNALRGRTHAEELIENIRNRKTVPVSPS